MSKRDFADVFKDKLLNINTEGRSEKYSDDNKFPYEPTPYSVLDRLIEEGIIDEKSYVIDFGSGMGRACIYLAEKTGCKCIGVECEEEFYEEALKNLSDKGLDVEFVSANVEEYVVPDDSNVMYFFNPFSEEIFAKVTENIIDSYYRNPREISLMMYYPSNEYISYLMTVSELTFDDEIDCNDLFDEDTNRNRIIIFTLER